MNLIYIAVIAAQILSLSDIQGSVPLAKSKLGPMKEHSLNEVGVAHDETAAKLGQRCREINPLSENDCAGGDPFALEPGKSYFQLPGVKR